jgi:voltage-gated potassium channel
LIFLILVYPFMENNNNLNLIFNIVFSLILLSAVYAVSHDVKRFLIGVVLGIPVLIGNWFFLTTSFAFIDYIFEILFYTYTIWILMDSIFKSKKVTMDLLMGAISVYLLLGILFAAVYSMIEFHSPNSLRFEEEKEVERSDIFYYSYSTLTTLGYGDVTPINKSIKSIAIIEVIFGQMYIAIMISKLVGIYIYQSTVKNTTPKKIKKKKKKT